MRVVIVAYARLLQLPVETVLQDFKQKTTSFETVAPMDQPSLKVLRQIKIDTNYEQHGSHWAIYTAIAILIMAAFAWGYNHHRQTMLKGISLPSDTSFTQSGCENSRARKFSSVGFSAFYTANYKR